MSAPVVADEPLHSHVLASAMRNGAAVACNALLVQRGTFDLLRGRALTFVMSVTYAFVGAGEALGGLFLDRAGARWIWAGSGGTLVLAAVAGALLARNLGGETAAAAEVVRASDSAPVAAAN